VYLHDSTNQEIKIEMAMNDWISLDVGGRKMSTARSTLLSNPSSALARMFDPDSGLQPARMVDGSYIIDADPDCFQVLLNWLRYKQVIFPTDLGQDYEGVSAVANYYGIIDLVEHIKSVKEGGGKVVLDVGGKTKMCISSDTFDKLRDQVRRAGGEEKEKRILEQRDGSYFIDADPDCFQVLLNWLRYKQVIFPTTALGQNYEGVSAVANYYGILDLVEHIKAVKEGGGKVVLDVGGRTKIVTSRYTFDKLRDRVRDEKRILEQADGSYVIDANPVVFEAVLDCVRRDHIRYIPRDKGYPIFLMDSYWGVDEKSLKQTIEGKIFMAQGSDVGETS